MPIEPISQITFTSKIKKLYKQGKIKLDRDIYDFPITPETVSDEHIVCKCFGGSSNESNIALAHKQLNNLRGCKPIEQFVTMKMVNKYVERLLKNNPPQIGDYSLIDYCNGILKTFKRIYRQ